MPRVLFVDDSSVARAVTVKRLLALGLDVETASSWSEARAIQPSGIAAALLDIDLGDGLGTDIAEGLLRARPDLPIAFLSAESEAPIVDRALRIGPVFSKSSEIEEAVRWIADRVRT